VTPGIAASAAAAEQASESVTNAHATVFTRDLDLPRGRNREQVRDRDRVYEIDGDESRALATVGAFRVVAESHFTTSVRTRRARAAVSSTSRTRGLSAPPHSAQTTAPSS
jgi:hypothetical protein